MNKLIFSLTLLSLSIAAHAQVYYFDTHADVIAEEQRSKAYRQKMIDNHISTTRMYSWKGDSVKGKKIIEYESSFDENGNMTEYKIYKHGKIDEWMKYKYDSNNRNTEYSFLKRNGEMYYAEKFAYDASGKQVETKMYWKRPDNNTWISTFTYDERSNMTESKTVKVKNQKIYERYVYTYYPDGSKKQTIQYNKKGKVEHSWNYDCNPAGKLADYDLKDSSRICIHFEKDKDGNMIKVKEENSKNGSVARSVRKFDTHDNMLEYIGYNSKGKQLSRIAYNYNEQHQATEYIRYTKSNEIRERSVAHYDSNGIMNECLVYKKEQKPAKIIRYEYLKNQ